jgi:ligand-binding sensor domain-containing protein
MKILLSVLLTLTGTNLCFAQQNVLNLHFNHVGVKEGLPEGRVTNLLQDRQGYVWFGTQKGMVRYDGYAPNVYDLGS